MKRVNLFIAIAGMLTACAGNATKEADKMEMVKQMAIDSVNVATVKKHTVDSMNTVAAMREEKAIQAAPASNSTVSNTTVPAKKKKKKGWSSTAKGAAIGGGVGIVAGAIIDKNHRGTGAVIGGVTGAVVGAGTGAIIDKNKKNKEAQKGNQ